MTLNEGGIVSAYEKFQGCFHSLKNIACYCYCQFLSGKRLDCFGLAYTVVAIAQTLGMKDVHLALSEDHAWVTFEENGTNTAEITWNGKGNEEKRAKPIDFGGTVDVEKNWLYLGRHEMKCNRHMEVAALVSAINPGINTKMDSETVGSLQQV